MSMEADPQLSPERTVNVGISIDSVDRIKCESCGCEIDVSGFEAFSPVSCPECGAEATVPGRLGPFLLLNLISTGGMGGVYHALDESLGRHVAIKVMLKSLGEDAEFVEDFKREAQAAARLNHPNVAQIYSFGQEKGQPYIVMELVSGKGFDKMIEDSAGKGLNQALVMQIGLDIAEGLQAGDEIGLTHGDIKPENILLDEKMRAKLVDFGIAQVQGQKQTVGVWGTPYYIAPERLKGKKSDARSDIYNLGATLFHALAGRPPFEGETPVEVVKARLDTVPPNLQEVRPELSKTVSDTIARMLEPEPAMRYPTYASLIGDLKRALQDVAPKGGPGALRGEQRKVFIRKKPRPGVLATRTAEDAAPQVQGGGKIRVRSSGYAPPPPPPPKPKSKAPKVFFTMVLSFMLAGGVVLLGYHLKQKRDREIEARRQAYLVKTEIEKVELTFDRISAAATNIVKIAPRVEPVLATTRDAARAVLGDELDTYDLSPREPPPVLVPQKEQPEDDGKDASEDAEEVDADAGDTEAAPEAAGDTVKAEASKTSGPDEAPEEQTEAAAGEETPEESNTVPETAEGEDTALPPEPELVAILRDVITEAQTVQACAQAAKSIAADAAVARDAAVEQTTAEAVTAEAGVIQGFTNILATIETTLLKSLENASAKADKAVELKTQFLKEKAEQQRLEELRRREEEQRQLEARELAQAQARDQELRVDVVAGNYRDVIATVKREIETYRTEGARKVMQALADRYTYLAELRNFLIERLNADPYGWGWVRPGGATEDVLGADGDGVKLRGRAVPWYQVSIPQYIRFIEHYLSNPKLRQSVRAAQYLATAIYCFENGGIEPAKIYLDKALDLAPHLRDEAGRVLPLPSDL